MTLIVVPTPNGPEIVNFDKVHCTQTSSNGVTLVFGVDANLQTKLTKEELIHEVLSAINRDLMPLHNHKSILIKKLKEDSNENNY